MSRASKTELVLGAPPSIDLTPSETKARRRGAGLRRALVMTLVGAIVIVAAAYGAAFVHAVTAAAQLGVAHARTEELLAQRQEYAEVIGVTRRSEEITIALEELTATEVLWKPFIDDLTEVFPADAALMSVTAQGRFPTDAELIPAGPLRQPLVASLTLVVRTTSLPDVAAWMRRVALLGAHADHAPTTVTNQEGRFITTVTVSLSDEALANRFGENAPDETATDDEATEEVDE
jgi:hypothetical protein